MKTEIPANWLADFRDSEKLNSIYPGAKIGEEWQEWLDYVDWVYSGQKGRENNGKDKSAYQV